MGDPPYVTSKPVRQDLRGSPWSAGQANSAERRLWKTVFRRLSTCLSTGILNIIVYHIICGKSTPIVENFMNSTKFPRGNRRKLWRAKTDKKRAFSTGGAAWKMVRYCLQAATAKRGHRSRLPPCSGASDCRRNCLCKKRQKPTKNPCSLPKTTVENLWKKKKSRKFRKKVCRRA